jgi:hypothetical protein
LFFILKGDITKFYPLFLSVKLPFNTYGAVNQVNQFMIPQDQFNFSSPEQLLEELENLIRIESHRSNNPWVSIDKLSRIFLEKYTISLERAVQTQGYENTLRNFFRYSKCFSIYGTQTPQDFYVALLAEVIPGYTSESRQITQYRIKRPWKVDGSLIRMLQSEGAEEVSHQRSKQQSPAASRRKRSQPTRLQSVVCDNTTSPAASRRKRSQPRE